MALPPGTTPQTLTIGSAGPVGHMRRRMRHPAHKFAIRTAPWCIQPVAIAPVIPGDTLEGARIQARVATDPLAAKLLGWWTELHLFYVKHRDTSESANLQSMVLSPPSAVATSTVSGGGRATYRLHGKPDFVSLALTAVVNWYFRDEGETASNFVCSLNNLPLAKIGVTDWTMSLQKTSNITAVDVALDGTPTASEVEAALIQYEWLRQNNLVQMTYEDWLATYGVRVETPAVNRPELLRSIREWSYPTNTITQGTGAVSSACVWSIAERVDKKRFFSEPGWLLAVSVTKPKVLRRLQPGAASNLMTDAYTWLPAVLRDDPYTSLVAMDTVSGALPDIDIASMTADIKDLLVYGDQFLAVTPSVAGGDSVAASGAWSANGGQTSLTGAITGGDVTSGRLDYPLGTLAERNQLFVGQVNETSLIQLDGVISFDIASSVVDTTPGVPNR